MRRSIDRRASILLLQFGCTLQTGERSVTQDTSILGFVVKQGGVAT
jgi:hypothetical protein